MADSFGGILKLFLGAAAIAVSFFVPSIAPILIPLGVSFIASGINSLLSSSAVVGFATASRNSIATWTGTYGECRPKCTPVFINEWGANNQMLDMIFVLSATPSQAVTEVLFDQYRLQIDTNAVPSSSAAGYAINAPAPGSGTSFTPVQQTVNIFHISRTNDVVTVVIHSDIPYLSAGDRIRIQNITGDLTLNGIQQVTQIVSRVGSVLTFQYLSGGPSSIVDLEGQAVTQWQDYARNVYVEFLLGDQCLGDTFIGMTAGTPWQGTGKLCTPLSPQSAGGPSTPNPWTSSCSLQGKTAAFVRITYSQKYFQAGLPQFSFLVQGKSDVYDPRLGSYGSAGTRAYTTNPALCIADFMCAGSPLGAAWAVGTTYSGGALVSYLGVDYISCTNSNTGNAPDSSPSFWVPVIPANLPTALLPDAITWSYSLGQMVNIRALSGGASHAGQYISLINSNSQPITNTSAWAKLPVPIFARPDWGYRMVYDTDIPLSNLIASANICDQPITLANGGTEPLYSLSGQFETSQSRGVILSDMLTSCAGRLAQTDGQYIIQPGYWPGPFGSPPTVIDLKAIAAGPAQWKSSSIRDLFNGVKGTYISPANKWQSTDFPYYAQDATHGYAGPAQYQGDANLAFDGGDRRWLELHLPFTISASTAQRIAKIELLRRRQFITGTFPCNMAGYQLIPLDVFEAAQSYFGWTTELLEVRDCRLTLTKKSSGSGEEVMVLGTEVDVQLTNSSIYAWSVEEELSPQGYQQVLYPSAVVKEYVCYPWSPGYVAPLTGDAIWTQGATGPANFGLQPVYSADAQGSATLNLQIKGSPPINSLDSSIYPPMLTCTASSTGGSLASGTYTIALSAFDGSGVYQNTDYHALYSVFVSGSGSGSISVTITWGSGDVGGDLYLAFPTVNPWQYSVLAEGGQQDAQNVFHFNQTLTTGQASCTITSLDQSQPGGIDTIFDHFGICWQQVIHSGVWAQQVQAVTGTSGSSPGTITIADPANGTTLNQYAGYTLSLLGRYTLGTELPILNMPVLSNTAASAGQFVLTIGQNSASYQLPTLTSLLTVGDLVVMRMNATFTSSSFTDLNWGNTYYPTGAVGVEAGHVAVVLSGADYGDMQTIASISQAGSPPSGPYVTFNLASTWNITPAMGDLVIIVDPTRTEIPTPKFSIPNKTTLPGKVIASPALDNYLNQTWMILVRTEDINGNHAPDFSHPIRDAFFFGAQGTRLITQ